MIEHQSAQKFALDNVLIDCVGNGLKDAIWRIMKCFSKMGLQMPSKGDMESLEMGLQMPSKVNVDRAYTTSTLSFDWKKYQNKSTLDLN